MYHDGGGGGGLHSLVATMCDQLGSHCAELTPGVTTIAADIETTTAAPAARRRTNLIIAASRERFPTLAYFSVCL
ncbi:hypothetical protein AWB95_04925 [Mycobacterium celatum]|uniref:Uncharacterized protein n=1 Tax=Mycobacterium celatum TaxID=28045 RepID=A0A1X1RV17_MYCCE|nr:hypothetical protein AWB95_04925 [Mycobacterium celatum]